MKPGMLLPVAALIAVLFFADRFLASLEHRELMHEAASLYEQGEETLKIGEAAAAIAPLQRAHTLARENRTYQLTLARALLEAGRLAEASSNLYHVLDVDSNDGAANLAMARLQARSGHNREAEEFYHRAIYGAWPAGNSVLQVRTELADFLAKRGGGSRLMSELILLQDESVDPAARKKIAQLFLLAGSAGHAAQVYRSVLRNDAEDVEAYAGLAEAELAGGDFHSAQADLQRALRRQPDDRTLQQRLQFATELTRLDPTPRRLTSKERYDRSARVLDLARADLAQCAQGPQTEPRLQLPIADPDQKSKMKGPFTNESAESLLDVAQAIWKTRLAVCGSPTSTTTENPLPLLVRKIGY